PTAAPTPVAPITSPSRFVIKRMSIPYPAHRGMDFSSRKRKAPNDPSGPSALGGAKYAARLSASRLFRIRVYARLLGWFKRNLDDDVNIDETPLCFEATLPRAAPAFHANRESVLCRRDVEQDAFALGASDRNKFKF